jgi:hypothetical protein
MLRVQRECDSRCTRCWEAGNFSVLINNLTVTGHWVFTVFQVPFKAFCVLTSQNFHGISVRLYCCLAHFVICVLLMLGNLWSGMT